MPIFGSDKKESTGEAMLMHLVMSLAIAAKIDPKKFAKAFSDDDKSVREYMTIFTKEAISAKLDAYGKDKK